MNVRSLRSRIARGGIAALLLLTAYFGVWSNHGRSAYVQAVALPALRTVTSPDDPSTQISASARVVVLKTAEREPIGHTSPAGFRFLLPGLFLIALLPHKPYWLGLFVGHLVLALVSLFVLVLGIAVHPLFFEGVTFVEQYLVDVFSLVVAVLGALHVTGAPSLFPSEDER